MKNKYLIFCLTGILLVLINFLLILTFGGSDVLEQIDKISISNVCDECGQKEKLSTYTLKNGEKERVCDYCKNMMKLMRILI